tara:strand:- start:129 stop:533 length:405 start_codon:yes stop_codon:yes gene_type:complete
MPHLQFDVNKELTNEQRKVFVEYVKSEFSEIMRTGVNHIAVSLREFPKFSLTLGRAKLGDFVCFMNLDVRNGRTNKQKRDLVIKYMEGVKEILGIELNNQYVTYTSHPGNDFNLYEKSLKEWTDSDNPSGKIDI